MAIESINNNATVAVSHVKTASKNSVDLKSQTSSATVNNSDIVSITPTATGIKNASETSTSAPAINESRVTEIKNALQSGRYQINPERIAEKMLQLETKLPNTT